MVKALFPKSIAPQASAALSNEIVHESTLLVTTKLLALQFTNSEFVIVVTELAFWLTK